MQEDRLVRAKLRTTPKSDFKCSVIEFQDKRVESRNNRAFPIPKHWLCETPQEVLARKCEPVVALEPVQLLVDPKGQHFDSPSGALDCTVQHQKLRTRVIEPSSWGFALVFGDACVQEMKSRLELVQVKG